MANPLALVEGANPRKRTAQDWADRGNRILTGHEPLKDGSFMYRNDVRWVVRDGRCTIEWI
jgi:hypothetical protein